MSARHGSVRPTRDADQLDQLNHSGADGSGTYDGDPPTSSTSLPLEATAPAARGDQTLTVGLRR